MMYRISQPATMYEASGRFLDTLESKGIGEAIRGLGGARDTSELNYLDMMRSENKKATLPRC